MVLGILAGSGLLPVAIARAAMARGERVVVVQVQGEDPALAAVADAYLAMPPDPLAVVSHLRDEGVERVVLAGGIRKPQVLSGGVPAGAQALLAGLPDRRDATILRLLVTGLESLGFRVAGQADYVPELLPERGVLTAAAPTAGQMEDARIGLRLARHLAGLDVGQTVVLRDTVVASVEAIEGTAEAIRRGGHLLAGAVVAKSSRPDQDLRYDMPLVGVDTIDAMAEVSAAVLAVEARRTILLDRDDLIARADAHRIAVVALEHTDGD